MIRRIPLVPTLIVAAAVAAMIALGIWQLQRKQWKEELLARYDHARELPAVAWPNNPRGRESVLYRHSAVICVRVLGFDALAGRSADGRSGWAHVARCQLDRGGEGNIAIGWSSRPQSPQWRGGSVAGIIGPAGQEIRLVAAPPQAGLTQLAAPDPGDLPNNHLFYAIQWFFFAATALVIYGLALRKRWGAKDESTVV